MVGLISNLSFRLVPATGFRSTVTPQMNYLATFLNIEELFDILCSLNKANLPSTVKTWKEYGNQEFKPFFKFVCELKLVKKVIDEDPTLSMDVDTEWCPMQCYSSFKKFLYKNICQEFDSEVLSLWFPGLKLANEENIIVSFTKKEENKLDPIFMFEFESGSKQESVFDSTSFFESFLNCKKVKNVLLIYIL